jgi:hypothetical protein
LLVAPEQAPLRFGWRDVVVRVTRFALGGHGRHDEFITPSPIVTPNQIMTPSSKGDPCRAACEGLCSYLVEEQRTGGRYAAFIDELEPARECSRSASARSAALSLIAPCSGLLALDPKRHRQKTAYCAVPRAPVTSCALGEQRFMADMTIHDALH